MTKNFNQTSRKPAFDGFRPDPLTRTLPYCKTAIQNQFSGELSVAEILGRIEKPKLKIRDLINGIRIEQGKCDRAKSEGDDALAKEHENKAKTRKLELPAVAWSVGLWSVGYRTRESVLAHSGFICVDLDDIDVNKDMASIKSGLQRVAGVFAVFQSPRNWLKIIFAYAEPIPLDYHEVAYQECVLAVNALLSGMEIPQRVDESGSDLARLCFVSYDEDMWCNAEVDLLKFEPDPSKRKTTVTIGKKLAQLEWTEAEIMARVARDHGGEKVQVHCLDGGQHKNDDEHPSAFYRPKTGFYHCFCGIEGIAKDRWKPILDIKTGQEYRQKVPVEVHNLSAELDPSIGEVVFLWNEWLPRKHLTIMYGDPSLGKSLLCLKLAVEVAQSGHQVLFYSSEETLGEIDLKVHRLAFTVDGNDDGTGMKFGADKSVIERFKVVTKSSYPSAKDIEEKCRDGEFDLVVVDALNSVIGVKQNDPQVRQVLEEWVAVAERFDFALLGIKHEVKDKRGLSRAARVSGSNAFGEVARSLIQLRGGNYSEQRAEAQTRGGRDGGRCGVMQVVANNLGADGYGFHWWSEVDIEKMKTDKGSVHRIKNLEVEIGKDRLHGDQLKDYDPPEPEPSARERLAEKQLAEESVDAVTVEEALHKVLKIGGEMPTADLWTALMEMTHLGKETVRRYARGFVHSEKRGNVWMTKRIK